MLARPDLIRAWQEKWDSENTALIFFNDFVHRFILDRTFVDFTVSFLILPFDIVDFNSKMVKSTVRS
jgi:hypothetical protein